MIGLSDMYWRLRRMLGRGRGIVQDDMGPVQLVQITPSNLETFDDVPRMAEYGFTSAPPDGWDGVAVFFSGDRSSGVVVATNHQQFRVRGLQKGEACVYDNQGQTIYFKKGGGILMTDKAGSVVNLNGDGTGSMTFGSGLTVNANVKVAGTLEVTQNITADKDVIVSGLSTLNHNHTDPQGGTVGPMQG
ncbi:MAG: phage baseplate assembly protein [Patescibacteria group bacterium]|nr:phage baseplate assembly protein [Patescibacteria group bacterium]